MSQAYRLEYVGMEEATSSKATMVSLTPENFHQWIRELKSLAIEAEVWKYVDPQRSEEEPEKVQFPKYSDYQVAVQLTGPDDVGEESSKPAKLFAELTSYQKEIYHMNVANFQMMQEQSEKVAQGIRIVKNALKMSARTYIPPREMNSSVRHIIKILANRYKLSDAQIVKQIHEQYQSLKTPPVK